MITIPFAAKRSKYKDEDGERVTTEEVREWRKLWLKSCGFKPSDIQKYLDNKNSRLVVCSTHVDPKFIGQDGKPVYHRQDPSKSVCQQTYTHVHTHTCKDSAKLPTFERWLLHEISRELLLAP